jgi:hypothetical protein
MLRIFEIRQQEERRKVLITLSGAYRDALRSELAQIKREAQSKFSLCHLFSRFVKTAVPVAGALWGRKKGANGSGGFLSRVFSGVKFAAELVGLIRKLAPEPPESETRARETTL